MIDILNIPIAISQLKLCYAFRGHNPNIVNCIDISNEVEILVVDDNIKHYSRFTKDEYSRDVALTVLNDKKKDIYLLSIDNCFFSNQPGGIADCALFDEYSFNFVEFKTNAQGNSIPQIELTYRDALAQLESTYQLFYDRIQAIGVDFSAIVYVRCIVVVNNHFPRQTAMEQDLIIEAAKGVNHIDLSFDSILYF